MKVEAYDAGPGRGRRVLVGDTVLSVAEAEQLRDELARELGVPQALTDREAMVWAVAFERRFFDGHRLRDCARWAADAVQGLRNTAVAGAELTDLARAMLAAMTGGAR